MSEEEWEEGRGGGGKEGGQGREKRIRDKLKRCMGKCNSSKEEL